MYIFMLSIFSHILLCFNGHKKVEQPFCVKILHDGVVKIISTLAVNSMSQ